MKQLHFIAVTFLAIGVMDNCVSLDLVIENARIIDGSGSPWFLGSVGVTNNEITHVGNITSEERENAVEIIDAQGQYLCPGFIDSHAHDDIALLTTPQSASKILQGVTTVITGNCGFSNYPDGENEAIQSHLSSLLGEIDPMHFFHNFSDYAAMLKSNGIGLNAGSLVGHGPLRISIIGESNRSATPEEVLEMQRLLAEQLEGGALGLSLGLAYPPSAYAAPEELVALASTVGKYGGILSAHIRSYEGNVLQSIDEFLSVLRTSGTRGLLSHLQVAGIPYWGTQMPIALKKLEDAIADGVDVAVDMYPYLAGSSTILQLLPPSAMADGFDAFVEKLKTDPEYFYILKELTENGTEPGWESKIALIGWNNVVINSVVNQELLPIEGLSMPDGAKKMGFETEFAFCIYVIILDEGRSNVIMFQQSQDDQNLVFQSKFQMVGSDSIPRESGKPHPRMYGSFPRVISKMGMGSSSLMSLEESVRKCTGLTSERFRLLDRGIIKPGMVADLVLFAENFSDTATYEDPESTPTGIIGVWIGGVRVVEDGHTLPELPGVVLKL